ncbi:MAG: hypothetical protein ACI8ZM_004909 [Crocinitomix sp.]|jgi:hypothetical protein
MKPSYFSIPKPCSADWNKMTPTEQGAFCTQCNKEVVDLYPVPSDQIKKTIASKNNPCIRILQSQIDEMNFTEWFRSLNLVKQLRYLFLFTLILVFQYKSQAQETDTTFIPYSNEYLDEIENAAIVEKNAEEVTETNKSDNENAIDSTAFFTVIPYPFPETGYWPPMEEGWMGVPPITPFVPWGELDIFEYDIAVVGGYMLTEIPTETPIKNQIILDQNVYEFKIIENQLHFTYKSIEYQKVRIKITDESGEVVYFAPIEVGIGENTISYVIDKFKFGHYTIILESEINNGSTKVIYL